jgi:hypothetical protein
MQFTEADIADFPARSGRLCDMLLMMRFIIAVLCLLNVGYLSAQETSPHFKGRQLPRWAEQFTGLLHNNRHLDRAVGPKFSGAAI